MHFNTITFFCFSSSPTSKLSVHNFAYHNTIIISNGDSSTATCHSAAHPRDHSVPESAGSIVRCDRPLAISTTWVVASAQRTGKRESKDSHRLNAVGQSARRHFFHGRRRQLHRFLPRDATKSTVLPWQVVRPSVCDVEVSRGHIHVGWNTVKPFHSLQTPT